MWLERNVVHTLWLECGLRFALIASRVQKKVQETFKQQSHHNLFQTSFGCTFRHTSSNGFGEHTLPGERRFALASNLVNSIHWIVFAERYSRNTDCKFKTRRISELMPGTQENAQKSLSRRESSRSERETRCEPGQKSESEDGQKDCLTKSHSLSERTLPLSLLTLRGLVNQPSFRIHELFLSILGVCSALAAFSRHSAIRTNAWR